MMNNKLVVVLMILVFSVEHAFAGVPLLSFTNRQAVNFQKVLSVGEIELLEFAQPVSLAHYGTSKQSLDYIELEKLEKSAGGYTKFMIKAKSPGSGVLTFESGSEVIKLKVIVKENYSYLENELNDLFGTKNAAAIDKIQVISANLVSDMNIENGPKVFLKGKVPNAKSAMLAVAFAANALGDHGVKIFSNPGGQLRMKDLDSIASSGRNKQNNNSGSFQNQSFVESYETANKLIDTNNINRDLVLASEDERVISFLEIAEPKRFAVKVRFLEMDTRMIDSFMSSVSATSTLNEVSGGAGSAPVPVPSINQASGLGTGSITNAITGAGTSILANQISSGNLVSGTVKLLDNVFLNIDINDLLNEGALRIVNEFSLITHSGEAVALGKGTRFPIPQINNSVGNSSITIEYIPIGFKGELKVTGLDSGLIDVQLASRLSSAEATATSIAGFNVPIFTEEYVNSGAMLADSQEVVLNAFLTESEANVKSTSPLGRIIPFLGSSKRKRKRKNLLFIAIEAEEIEPSSLQVNKENFDLPHIDINKQRNIYAHHTKKLERIALDSELDLAKINSSKLKKAGSNLNGVDALDLDEDF
jgi:Flp pilus assembly secretin CpaC